MRTMEGRKTGRAIMSVQGLPGMRSGAFAGRGGFGDRLALVQAIDGASSYRVVLGDLARPLYVSAQLISATDHVLAGVRLTTMGCSWKQARVIGAAIAAMPGWTTD